MPAYVQRKADPNCCSLTHTLPVLSLHIYKTRGLLFRCFFTATDRKEAEGCRQEGKHTDCFPVPTRHKHFIHPNNLRHTLTKSKTSPNATWSQDQSCKVCALHLKFMNIRWIYFGWEYSYLIAQGCKIRGRLLPHCSDLRGWHEGEHILDGDGSVSPKLVPEVIVCGFHWLKAKDLKSVQYPVWSVCVCATPCQTLHGIPENF